MLQYIKCIYWPHEHNYFQELGLLCALLHSAFLYVVSNRVEYARVLAADWAVNPKEGTVAGRKLIAIEHKQ